MPVEISVIGVQGETLEDSYPQSQFHAIKPGAAHVFRAETPRHSGDRPALDQVFDLAMEIVRAYFQSLGEEILLGAEIYFPTFLRTEVWIAEGGATEGRREEQLVQRRRSKALGIATL